jgi:pfkB family carbohydrate kinase
MSTDRPADRPVVLVVGAASRDVTDEDPRGWRLGGAVTFTSLALARFGFEVRAVAGADAEAASASELELLRAADVALAIAPLETGPVFDNVSHLLHSGSDRMPLTALPRRWTSGHDGLLFAPVASEIGDEWTLLASGEPPPVVGLGWQGLLRLLAAGDMVRPGPVVASALVRAATLVVVSAEDLAPGTRPDDVGEVLDPRATLAWTEGAAGGFTVHRDAGGAVVTERYPAIPSDSVVDATGAGDVFLAAWLAATIRPSLAAPFDALVFAAAAGSLAVEDAGLLGVPDLAAVRARMDRLPNRPSRRPSAASSRGSGRPSQA